MRAALLAALVMVLAVAQTTTAPDTTTAVPPATTQAVTTTTTAQPAPTTTQGAAAATTTTTTAAPTTVPGAPWTGEEAARALRFAKNDVALAVVDLVSVAGSGNATVITTLASAAFLVQVDRLAQLTLPGSWAQYGASGAQIVVSLIWNKTSPVNYTVTQTSPTPFAAGGLSVAFYEAWIGVNQGVPEVHSCCFSFLLLFFHAGGGVADAVQRRDGVWPGRRSVRLFVMYFCILRSLDRHALQRYSRQRDSLAVRRARLLCLARPRRRQSAVHILLASSGQLCAL
jgi:cytochrome c5